MTAIDPADDAPDGPSRPEGVAAIPAYEAGGRVDRTGIALVHEGEYIVPAAGSEAVIAEGGQVIHYHFPVEIEVIGELSDVQMRAMAEHLFRELNEALDSRR